MLPLSPLAPAYCISGRLLETIMAILTLKLKLIIEVINIGLQLNIRKCKLRSPRQIMHIINHEEIII